MEKDSVEGKCCEILNVESGLSYQGLFEIDKGRIFEQYYLDFQQVLIFLIFMTSENMEIYYIVIRNKFANSDLN